MIRAVVLDSAPLALAVHRRGHSAEADSCQYWLRQLARGGVRVFVPEIVDYEVRRELLRARKTTSIARLDALRIAVWFFELTGADLLRAAELWAQSRQQGLPTAGAGDLDIDVILAAQVLALGLPLDAFIVATSNPRHLSRFVRAARWEDVQVGGS